MDPSILDAQEVTQKTVKNEVSQANSLVASPLYEKYVVRDLIFEGVVGSLQINALWRLLAAKTPPTWRPTWALQKTIFEAQLGLHFGEGLGGSWAPMTTFGGSLLGPYLDPPKFAHSWISILNCQF